MCINGKDFLLYTHDVHTPSSDSQVKMEEISEIMLVDSTGSVTPISAPESTQPSPSRRVNPRRRVTTGTVKPLSEEEVHEATPTDSRSGTESGPVTRRTSLRQRRNTEPAQPVIDIADDESTPESS